MQAIGRRQSALKLYFSGRIEGLSVYHHVLMAFAGWFFVFTVIGDIYQVTGILSFAKAPIWILGIGLLLNVIFLSYFFVFPCAFAGWGIYYIKHGDYHLKGKFFLLNLLMAFIGWIASTFFCVVCLLPIFVFADMIFANTIIPLSTVLCGIVWLVIAAKVIRKLQLNRRVLTVTSMLLLILAVKYIDWSPKKSFARDLLQIRNGMTGVQVETIMKYQQKNFVQPELEHFLHLNLNYTGKAVFRDNSGEDIGIIEFQDGYVVDVKYVPE